MTGLPGRRRAARSALLVVLGAAATVSASALTWWTQAHRDALAGDISTGATGSQLDPLLVPVAVLALAGFGAAVATGGLLRRVIGVVLVAGGAVAAVSAVKGWLTAPASLQSDLNRPAEYSGSAVLHLPGPLLAVVGGVFVAAGGVLLLAGAGARRALGARYDAPTGRLPAGVAPAGAATDPTTDADAAVGWWRALDSGQDPTDPSARVPVRSTPGAFHRPDSPVGAQRDQGTRPPADLSAPVTRPPQTPTAGVSDDATGGG